MAKRPRSFDELAALLGEKRRTRSTGKLRKPPPGIPEPGSAEYRRLLAEALELPHTQRTQEMRAVVKWERERVAASRRFDLTDNERLRVELIRHQIYVLRFANGEVQTVQQLLSATEDQLRGLIERKTGALAGRPYTAAVRKKLDALLAEVRELRRATILASFKSLRSDLLHFSQSEGKYMVNAASAISSVQLELVSINPATLRALVDARPFEGRVLKDWASKVIDDDIARIEATLRKGLIDGRTPQQMASSIVGTVRARGSDGVTQLTRNAASAVARTAVNSLANVAREEVFEANEDVFDKEMYVATLDSRTTLICSSLDGSIHKVGEGPMPPQHMNCRSIRVAIIDKEAAGQRPMKPITEQEVLRRYNAANGTMAGSRDTLPRGHKGRFDVFARVQVRQITGAVPAKTTYAEFLKAQPSWFQDDVLGATRGALFRKGGLTLDKFVDKTGQAYTLAELAARQREAFFRAGLDPDEFT